MEIKHMCTRLNKSEYKSFDGDNEICSVKLRFLPAFGEIEIDEISHSKKPEYDGIQFGLIKYAFDDIQNNILEINNCYFTNFTVFVYEHSWPLPKETTGWDSLGMYNYGGLNNRLLKQIQYPIIEEEQPKRKGKRKSVC